MGRCIADVVSVPTIDGVVTVTGLKTSCWCLDIERSLPWCRLLRVRGF